MLRKTKYSIATGAILGAILGVFVLLILCETDLSSLTGHSLRQSVIVGQGAGMEEPRVERHGNLNLNIREVAHWQPHWPNPFGYRQTLAIAWSPDGMKLAVAYDWGTKIKVIDPNGRAHATASVPNGPNITTSLAFLNGSSQVLYVGQETNKSRTAALTLFDAKSGRLLRTIPGPNPGRTDLANHAKQFAVSPDGKLVATTLYGRSPLIIYRTDKWTIIRRIEAVGASAPIFLADSRHIAVSTLPSRFMIIDALNGSTLTILKAPESDDFDPNVVPRTTPAATIAISPDQRFMFAGTQWKFVVNSRETIDPRGAAQVFDLAEGISKATFDLATPDIGKAVWDPKNRFVAFVDDASHLFLWQPFAHRLSYLKVSLPSKAWSLAMSPDGFQIAISAKDGVTIYEIR